jgi:glycogen synthase
MTVHSLEPKRPWKAQTLGNSYRLSAWAEKIGLEACDRVIAVSHADKQDIIECFDITPDRIKVIPNGVDSEAFHHHENQSILRKYGVKKPYILFLGRLSRQKGIFDLVSAVPKLPPEIELVLATGAPDEVGLTEELNKKLEDSQNIIWINKMLPLNEVVSLLSGASIFVAPSIYEPFGIMNLEAMACARPVVSTRVGGIVDVVLDGQTGLLVSPGKPEELADAINRILSNPTLGERMGKAGRTRIETLFTWNKVAEDTLSLYQEIVR